VPKLLQALRIPLYLKWNRSSDEYTFDARKHFCCSRSSLPSPGPHDIFVRTRIPPVNAVSGVMAFASVFVVLRVQKEKFGI